MVHGAAAATRAPQARPSSAQLGTLVVSSCCCGLPSLSIEAKYVPPAIQCKSAQQIDSAALCERCLRDAIEPLAPHRTPLTSQHAVTIQQVYSAWLLCLTASWNALLRTTGAAPSCDCTSRISCDATDRAALARVTFNTPTFDRCNMHRGNMHRRNMHRRNMRFPMSRTHHDLMACCYASCASQRTAFMADTKQREAWHAACGTSRHCGTHIAALAFQADFT